MSRKQSRLVLTCEHASRALPAAYRARFTDDEALLASHRGWDPGALDVARARTTASRAARRRRHHPPARRSEPLAPQPRRRRRTGRRLPKDEQRALIARYHAPHWARVREVIRAAGRGDAPPSVAVHSFVPVLDGDRRDFEIGLLYDLARAPERRLAAEWKRLLLEAPGALRVRRNEPYRGNADGLRHRSPPRLPATRYAGFGARVNQAALEDASSRRALVDVIATTLRAIC
ncbi:MAG: N-formylglutamate amidohydrolase [Myxococcota bacterium]